MGEKQHLPAHIPGLSPNQHHIQDIQHIQDIHHIDQVCHPINTTSTTSTTFTTSNTSTTSTRFVTQSPSALLFTKKMVRRCTTG